MITDRELAFQIAKLFFGTRKMIKEIVTQLKVI